MPEYYYQKLDTREQAVYRKCREAVEKGRSETAVGRITAGRLTELLKLLSFDHPEFFYVDFRTVETTDNGVSGVVWNIHYACPPGRIRETAADMERVIGKVMATADRVRGASDLAKCRWIHDVLVRNVRYDYQAMQAGAASCPEAYTVEGVLRHKRGVCEGIALTAALLGDRLGISLPVVTGESLSSQFGQDDDHAWNLARIDGTVSHLDITWDICVSAVLGRVRYDYFCIPDAEIRADHKFENRDARGCPADACPDFFRKTGRFFTTFRQCEEFVSAMAGRGERTIYFKYLPAGVSPADEEKRMQNMVLRKCALRLPGGGRLLMNHNLPLGIFYYNIGTEEKR